MTQKHQHLTVAGILAVLIGLNLDNPLVLVAIALVVGNVVCAAHENAEERW